MSSLSRTEFRTVSDRQAQARLERMLANRRAAEAKRKARFSKLRTPSMVEPEPETVPTWVAWALMCALSPLLTMGALAFAIWLPTLRGWLA